MSLIDFGLAALNTGLAIYWVMTGEAVAAAVNGAAAVFCFGVAMLIKNV